MVSRALVLLVTLAVALNGCAATSPRAKKGDTGTVTQAKAPEVQARPEVAAPVVSPPAPVSAPTPAPAPAVAQARQPAVPAQAAPTTVPAVPERYVSLNFDNADISVVIQTIAELLHLNYIVSPSVKGRITIQTSEKLPVSALLPVLEQILEVNNFMAVKSGAFYKIVPANQAKQELVETVGHEASPSAATGLITKIVRLRFISPAEVVKIITPFKTAAGIYQAHEPLRLLFLTEVPTKIADLMKIIEVLDVDTFASIQVELYPVRFANVDELAKELTQIVTMVYSSAGKGRTLFRIVPVPQIGALMVFSGEPSLTETIRGWIAKLDQPAAEANERIFLYPLSHASAETLAGVLKSIFTRDQNKSTPKAAAPTAAPAARAAATGAQPATTPAPALAAPAQIFGDGFAATGGAPVSIVADKDTNTLIIQTASWFYPTVEEVIRKLDAMPKQVLIEVLIAEVTLDETNQFGIQWALKGQGSVSALGETHNLTSTTKLKADATTEGLGLTFSVVEANRISAAITAYAQDSKLNILSAPHIIASNNKEAKIDVGQEVPILKSRTTGATGSSSTDTVTNDIEYRSTGIILTVTPHVNEGGVVTLDLNQEVSEAQANNLGGTTSPIIRKRTAKTTMVVKDQQTLVVGGLIYEKQDRSREGLPGLHDIPIIGYLFGSKAVSVTKTELVLLITPRIINNPDEGDRMTQEVKDRVLTLKKRIDTFGVTGAHAAP